MEKREITKKVCLLGDSQVGKTSLIRRYVHDQFDDMYIMTFGAKVSSKNLNLYTDEEEIALSLGIWDIVGEHSRRSLQASHYKGSAGALVTCDSTRHITLEHLEDWVDAFMDVTENPKFVFLLNKIDLHDRAEVTYEDVKHISARYCAECFATSAKTGENVESAFKTLAEKIVFNK